MRDKAGREQAPLTPWWQPTTVEGVEPLLNHRRWWWHDVPFAHVVAVNVFTSSVYEALQTDFLSWQAAHGGGVLLRNHDLRGMTLTSEQDRPLALFASRGWHDLLQILFDVPATRHVNVGLHHHAPWSAPGFPHTDVNPGWFPNDDPGDGVVLADPARVEYTSGRTVTPGAAAREVVRAVAVLFYLANPPWEPGHRGETGLFVGGSDEPDEAVAVVPPHNNSLLAFECTPFSFHAFCGGGRVARNSVVHWLHRERRDAELRWGTASIIGYGDG